MTTLEIITFTMVAFTAGLLYGLLGTDTTDQKWGFCIFFGIIILVCTTIAITLRMAT